jgi:uncharacterized phage-associated protein
MSSDRAIFSEDTEKLRELALFLAKESENDPNYGKTKLTKLLFYCDFFAYAALGKPITGARYAVWDKGPSLARFYELLDELKADGDAAMQEVDHFGFPQHRMLALRKPRLSRFNGDEVALIREVLQLFKDKNATEMSEGSHRLHAWKAFEVGETIPYAAVFVSNRKLTQRERDHALTLSPTPLSECA